MWKGVCENIELETVAGTVQEVHLMKLRCFLALA